MTRFEQLEIIVREAMRDRKSKDGYAKVAKALMEMDINAIERGKILYMLGYAGPDGEPYRWIFEKRKR